VKLFLRIKCSGKEVFKTLYGSLDKLSTKYTSIINTFLPSISDLKIIIIAKKLNQPNRSQSIFLEVSLSTHIRSFINKQLLLRKTGKIWTFHKNKSCRKSKIMNERDPPRISRSPAVEEIYSLKMYYNDYSEI
jgi:hypothetical protein